MPATTQSTTQGAGKRRKMTIEDALRWAIRDELPKRRQDAPICGAAVRVRPGLAHGRHGWPGRQLVA